MRLYLGSYYDVDVASLHLGVYVFSPRTHAFIYNYIYIYDEMLVF